MLKKRRIKKLIRGIPYLIFSSLRSKNAKKPGGSISAGSYLLPVESQNEFAEMVPKSVDGEVTKRSEKILVELNEKTHFFVLKLQDRFLGFKNTVSALKNPVYRNNFYFKLKSFKPSPKLIRPVLAIALIISILIQTLFPNGNYVALGATYTFTQTDWSGGADTSTVTPNVNYPAHAAGQDGWTKYTSKDNSISIFNASLQLTSSSFNWVETTAADFTSGTRSNVYVSSTLNAVRLLKPLNATCSANSECNTGICENNICATPPCNYETSTVYSGQTYNLVEIGTQCWIKQNLNVGSKILNGVTPSSNTSIEKWCIGNNDVNNGSGGCDTGSAPGAGGIYTWPEVMQLDPGCATVACAFNGNRQGICPSGYHLPSDNEWQTLEQYLGMCSGTAAGCSGATGSRGTDIGTKLKIGGSSGLDLLLSGYRSSLGSLTSYNTEGLYWSATKNLVSSAYTRIINSGATIFRSSANSLGVEGNSARCLKDRGLAVGVGCTSDSQCASGYCPAGSPRVCKIPTGNSCLQSSDCGSGLCENNVCRVATAGACSQNTDCRIDSGASCVAGTCRKPIGEACTNASSADATCVTNWCGSSNTCALKPNGTACGDNAECTSNVCSTTCIGPCEAATTCGTSCSYGSDTYPTVQIGTQCWIGKNINIGTMLGSASTLPTAANGAIEKWCYSNSAANCTNKGGLYDWVEANQLASTCYTQACTPPANNQGVCPSGWHVPTDGEFMVLEEYLGMCSGTGAGCSGAIGYRGTNEGTKLLVGGSSGFNATTTGERYDWGTGWGFDNLGIGWLNTASQGTNAGDSWYRYLVPSNGQVYRASYRKSYGYPVRCIKNPSTPPTIVKSPASLAFSTAINTTPTPKTFTIDNNGGSVLNWGAVGNRSWCLLSPTSGVLFPSDPATTVTVSPTSQSSVMNDTCTISIGGAGVATTTLSVTYNVFSPIASILASPTSLNFSSLTDVVPAAQNFTLTNSGNAVLNWSGDDNQGYCGISPSSGSLNIGANSTITVSMSAQSASGTYPCTITISDPAASNNPQTVSVSHSVTTPVATINRSPASLTFNSNINVVPASQNITLINSGTTVLNWTGTDNQSYCSISPAGSSLGVGATTTIAVSMSSQAVAGSYPCTVTITDPAASNSPQTVSVTHTVSSGPVCGNSIVEAGEACDPPGQVQNCSVSGNNTCAADCMSWINNSCNNGSPGSCPYVYGKVDNSGSYEYITDLMGKRLGHPRWDISGYTKPGLYYIGDHFVQENNYYKFKIRETIGEADFFDLAELWVADVPAGYKVYSDFHNSFNVKGMVTGDNLFTVKDPRSPVSAFDKKSVSVLRELSEVDDNPVKENSTSTNYYTLDFGTIQHPEYAKLIVYGWDNYLSRDIKGLLAYPNASGTGQNTIIEVVNQNGEWQKVKEFGTMLGDTEPIVFDIANVWLSDDHRIRIHPAYRASGSAILDKIEFDDSVPVNITINKIKPSLADLHWRGTAWTERQTYSHSILAEDNVIPTRETDFFYGYFTKYGNVLPLLQSTDNKYVIMRHGDEMTVDFPVPEQQVNTDRKFFLYADVFYTVRLTPQGEFLRDTIDLLPFHGMTQYPYNTSTENYPYDEDRIQYIREWNTRFCEKGQECVTKVQSFPGYEEPGLLSKIVDGVVDGIASAYEVVVSTFEEFIIIAKDVIVADLFEMFTIPVANAQSINSGSFTSQVKDIGSRANFTSLSWNENLDAGTSITMEARAGNGAIPDGSWSVWTSVSNGGSLTSLSGNRYIQYRATLSSTVSDNNVPQLNDVTVSYITYALTGQMISSPYDSGDAGNVMGSIGWDEDSLPSGTSVTMELRTADNVNMSGASSWYSPSSCDPGPAVYCGYTTLNNELKTGGNDRYFQYRVTLNSDGSGSPLISAIRVQYVVNAPPEVQNVTASQASNGTVGINYEAKSTDAATDTGSLGVITPTFQLCRTEGGCQTITSGFLNDATSTKAVHCAETQLYSGCDGTSSSVWANLSASWNPAVQFPDVYDTGATIKVIVDDRQAANRYGEATSTPFTLDTRPPVTVSTSLKIAATSSPAILSLTTSDDSPNLQMKVGTSLAALNAASYEPYSSNRTLTLGNDPATVYVQFRDSLSNESSIISAVTPQTPSGVMVQDTSNFKVNPREFRLFLAWKVVSAPTPGFGGYQIYRGTSGTGPWTLLYTETDIARNFYADNTALENVLYYYKIATVDLHGNTSFSSQVIDAMADGREDFGEGGGGDSPAPLISNVQIGNITGSSALVTWDTNILSNSRVNYSRTEGVFDEGVVSISSMVDNSGTQIGGHSVLLSNLYPNTRYYFEVSSANSEGTLASDNNGGNGYFFDTTAGPVISTPSAVSVGNTEVTITWSTDIDSNSEAFFSTSTSFAVATSTSDATLTTAHSLTKSGFLPNTTYFFYVRSTGGGGTSEDRNVINGVPVYYSFHTTNDTGLPVFSDFTATPNTSTAILTFRTDKDTDTIIDYGPTPAFGSSTVLDPTLTKIHTATLTELLPSTQYFWRARSTDGNGNTGTSANQQFTTLSVADSAPPIISNIATSSISLNSATITWNTNKGTNGTVSYGLDNQYGSLAGNSTVFTSTTHSVTLTSLSGNTLYHFRVNSTDAQGNSASSPDYTFLTTADVAAPAVSNRSRLVNQTAAFINWDTSELANGQVDYGLTPGSYNLHSYATSTYSITHSVLLSNLTASTTYYYRILTADQSGNVTTDDNGGSGYNFTTDAVADTTPPVISSLQTSSIALNRATISWLTDKPANGTVDFGTTPQYGSIMGNLYNFSTSTHTVNLTDLQGNTRYYFRVNSVDVLGNSASSTGEFTTMPDVTPPVISATTTIANDTAAFVNWRTDELAYPEVNYGLTPFTMDATVTITSTPQTNHSLPLTGLSPSTTYYYRIVSFDPSSNTSTLGPYSFLTPAFGMQTIIIDNSRIIDNTRPTDDISPVISNIKVSNDSPFAVSISWTTDEESSSLVRYGRTVNYGSTAGDYINRTSNHLVHLNNLLPGTTYNFIADSFDAKGNLGSSGGASFTTLNLDGSTAEPTPESDPDKDIVDSVLTAPIKLLTRLLTAFANNPALKELSEEAVTKTFTDIAERVINAPSIVGLRPQVEVEGNKATIRWSTDKKTTGLVSFAKEAEYQPAEKNPYTTTMVDTDNISTVHSVVLTNLEPATRYHFQVASKGEIGPEARSKDYTFETEDVLPEIADARITDIKATSVIVSWKSNVPTASLLEYTNLTTKKTLTAGDPALLVSHTFTLNNLEPGTDYSLVVKGKNESGKEGVSKELPFSTIIDKLGPKIMNATAASTLYPGATSKVQTIISFDTDEPTKALVYYQEGVMDNPDKVRTTTLDKVPVEKHIIVLTSFRPGTVYKYWIEAEDQSGNKSKSESFTTLTPVEKETIIDIITNNFQSVFGWTKNVGM